MERRFLYCQLYLWPSRCRCVQWTHFSWCQLFYSGVSFSYLGLTQIFNRNASTTEVDLFTRFRNPFYILLLERYCLFVIHPHYTGILGSKLLLFFRIKCFQNLNYRLKQFEGNSAHSPLCPRAHLTTFIFLWSTQSIIQPLNLRAQLWSLQNHFVVNLTLLHLIIHTEIIFFQYCILLIGKKTESQHCDCENV